MIAFPSAFTDALTASFGADTAARVLTALGSEAPSVSVRFNPFRLPEAGTEKPIFVPDASFWDLPDTEKAVFVPVPWSPHGYLLSERPNFTLDPLFHAGCYYVQDSSAMFVGELLRRVLLQLHPGVKMLDLCAAPGGKTTDAAASLRERFGERFTLLANEVMRNRYAILRGNVRSWGDPRVGVTNLDPAVFGREREVFDILLADVPCSGEGMFRKDSRALAEWSPETVAFCASRQRRILSDAWPALRDGGILIYATCTFNATENDDNVRWIAETLGAEVLDMGEGGEGILRTPAGGYALLPGLVPGEGQYAAVLRKNGDAVASGDPFRVFRGEIPWTGHGMTEGTGHGMTEGTGHGMTEGGPLYEIDRRTALNYLHGDALRLPDAPPGLITLTYRGVPLGPAKNIGSRCNNLYPKDRRIRMDIPNYED